MKSSNYRKILLALSSVVALILGFLIYVFFRTDTYISKIVINIINIDLLEFKNVLLNNLHLPNCAMTFLQNFSCDILWSYSLTVVLFLVIGADDHGLLKIFLICALFEIGVEYLQRLNIFSGTCDIADIFFEIVVSASTLLIIKMKEGSQ